MEDFTFLDGERLVCFGNTALSEAPSLLQARGFDGYALLTTERALADAPALAEAASITLEVPAGQVPEAAAAVRGNVGRRPLVALGGGRVVDCAKAIAGADDLRCATVATTLSGAEMTGFHRMPAGVDRFRLVRPALVIAAPELMASHVTHHLTASAMNALAHAFEALYTPLANPITNMTALRGAGLLAAGIELDDPDREGLSLGAILAGYSVGITGMAVAHVVCQTIVRVAETSHSQTYAVMLPHFVRLMSSRAPAEVAKFSVAVGAGGDPEAAAVRVATLASRSEVTRLSEIGFDPAKLSEVVSAAIGRGDMLANTPQAPDERELRQLLEEAL